MNPRLVWALRIDNAFRGRCVEGVGVTAPTRTRAEVLYCPWVCSSIWMRTAPRSGGQPWTSRIALAASILLFACAGIWFEHSQQCVVPEDKVFCKRTKDVEPN